jgi:protein-S-isoprenylcysteine O-methyltransferase Ste14
MDETSPPPRLLYLSIVRILCGCALIAAGLFWTADTFDFPRGWLFVAVLAIGLVASALWLWRANPEIFAARRRAGLGTKAWDYAMVAAVAVGFTAVLWIAGFDRRFGWSQLPGLAVAGGYLSLLAGTLVITLAQAANRHFEPTVRIQSDRGHRVIDTGLYAHIRHPGYAGGILVVLGMALALGSGWALAGVAALAAVLAVRTVLEERTLRAELPGYADYTQRVKYRWVPGLW